jgi:hypothetical protein
MSDTNETAETQYTVSVACSFDATSYQDAVQQMVAWIADNAYMAGYRATNDDTGESLFVDAEDMFLDTVVRPVDLHERAAEFFAEHGHADDSYLDDYDSQRYPFLRAETFNDGSRNISAWTTLDAAQTNMLAGVTAFIITNVITGEAWAS